MVDEEMLPIGWSTKVDAESDHIIVFDRGEEVGKVSGLALSLGPRSPKELFEAAIAVMYRRSLGRRHV